ncbi:MAG: hypothetical protein AAB403_16645 [Planctomycetota bacterium]
MTTKRSVVRIVIFLAVTPSLISGCAANRVDLVDAGVLTLEQHSTGKVFIAWSNACEDGDGFVVAGVLRRRDHVGLPIRAHVDVTILSPDEAILDESRSPDVYVPRRITGRGQSLKRFEVRFPHLPPQGSSVRLVCHSDAHSPTM